MDLQLIGHAAFITGGSEGIGKAAAMELAAEGASVAICARRGDVLNAAADEIRGHATGGKVLAIEADVSRREDIERAIRETVSQMRRIDILVNNAGTSAAAPFDSVTDEAWGADLDLKLMAAVRASQQVIPHMRQQGGGRIINITHVGGKAPTASSLPTSVSRAAGIALTKAMSKDLAADGILVNTICVGLIKSGQITRAAQRRFPDAPEDEAFARMGANIPMGRIGEAREVATLIAFLASPAGGYITGASINVDGGMGATV